jgi:hypothetical protein
MESTTGDLIAYLSDNDGHCIRCGYNLRGLPEPRCPECRISFADLDTERYIWLNNQVRLESRMLLFALVLLPIEMVFLAPITIGSIIGFWTMVAFDGFNRDRIWLGLLTCFLISLLSVWITSWAVFFRARRNPLARFSISADGPMKPTRIGRAVMIINLFAVIVGVAMITLIAYPVWL